MRVSGAGERCIKLKTNIMQADDYTIIDRYLQGELSAEEQADFELRLQSDAALAAQLNFRQQANTYLRTQQKLPDLEKKMASLSKDYFATADKAKIRRLARRRLFYVVGVAAAIALLLLVWNPFSSGNMYGTFADHPPLALVERAGNEATAAQAEEALEAGNYKVAYELLRTLSQATPSDPQLQLALGISALETDRFAEAEASFSTLATGNSALKEYGSWYQILLALKKNQAERVRTLLDSVSFSDPALQAKAQELKAALD